MLSNRKFLFYKQTFCDGEIVIYNNNFSYNVIMKKIWQVVFLIVGSIIGAGFASGRELSLFFAEFGYASLYFLPIVFILFYYCFKLFLSIGACQKFENIMDMNNKTNSTIFFNICIIFIYIIYSSAMFSGSVEVLSCAFIEIPSLFFYALVFCLSFFVYKGGLKGLLKINAVLIPLIILLLVLYSIYSTINPITTIPYIPSSEKAYILPISIIIYVMANILLSYFILSEAGNGLTKKQIQTTSFLASLVICFVILICIICLITNGAVVMDASMPFVLLTLRLGEPFPIIFMFVLFLGIITSLFCYIHTVCSCLPFKNKNKTALICCCTVLLISLFSFEKIVNYCYPLIGIFGIVLIFKFLRYNSLSKARFNFSNKVIHPAGKNTENKNTSHNKV